MGKAVGMRAAIVELRQYTLHPGRRDELIELFEREFLESQEAAGITLIGQFRALDDPDRFVWLRGFAGMANRAKSLAAFYDGPVWAAHRNAANATMVDSDNVLLLRPAHGSSGFAASNGAPFPKGDEEPSGAVYVAGICYLDEPADDHGIASLERVVMRTVEDFGGRVLAWYVSEQSPNNYPRLPIREAVNAAVWFAGFPNVEKAEACLTSPAVVRSYGFEALKLIPTPRSRLR